MGGPRSGPHSEVSGSEGAVRDVESTGDLHSANNTPEPWGEPSYRTIKGILIAGTETATEAGDPAGAAGDVPAFLHGPKTLFEPVSDNDDLAPVLELPTGAATSPNTGEANRAAHA